MIWLTWRQFRVQTWAALAALAVIAITLAITGLHLSHSYDTSGIATCHAHRDCATLASNFLSQVKASTLFHLLYLLGIAVLIIAPAIMGIFWGAPLVTREIETGTFALAWNQSVTRTRWLAVKLSLIGLASMITAGLLSLMVTWSSSPIDQTTGLAAGSGPALYSRLTPLLFGARGIAPIGYAAFAFALGVTTGVLIRRTVPAMAITLVVFAAVQIAMPLWVRPHLIPPARTTTELTAGSASWNISISGPMSVTGQVNIPGAWVLSNQTITTAGHVFAGPAASACLTGSGQACSTWLAGQHLRQVVTYQPASRYWALQWYETAIFLALALVLAGCCAWRIRGRRS